MHAAKFYRLGILTLIIQCLSNHVLAETFNVSSVDDFQTALTTAQDNGEDDTINVASGTYNVASTLTYTATGSENFSLTINGSDSDLCILDGGSLVSILRINTQLVTADDNIAITVSNMTFQNGNAAGDPSDGGALAILMDDTGIPAGVSVNVTGSEFYDNAADGNGGAILIRADVDPPSGIGILLEDLTINGNQARGISDDMTGNGGGVQVLAGTSTGVLVRDVDMFNNTAVGNGGGIEVRGALGPAALITVFEDILFFNNDVTGSMSSGGGAAVDAVDLTAREVGFVDNTATFIGGGLHLRGNTRMILENSGFVGNEAPEGGGLATDAAFDSGLVLTNNTFTGNMSTGRGGGAFLQRGGSTLELYIYNNILWGNFSETGQDLFVNDDPADLGGFDVATIRLFNNDFSSFETKCQTSDLCTEDVDSGDNIDADPLFVDVADRPLPNVRLMAGSPAIDAGLNSGAPVFGAPETDFEGDVRPLDGDGDSVATIDIGLDEFSGMVPDSADIIVTVSDSADPVTEGDEITYTVTVRNNGPDDATAVMLTGTLDSMLGYVSSNSTQGSCTETSGVVTCALGDLVSGSATSVTIVASTPDVPETVTVSLDANASAAEADPDTDNNSASETTMVVPQGPAMADLAVTLSDSPDPVVSGAGTLTYTVNVTNNGPDGATGVILTDTLPAGVMFVSASFGGGTCDEMASIVTCTLGDIALNSSSTVTVVVQPDVVESAVDLNNSASVSGSEMDPNTDNNSATVTTTVNPPSSDLLVDGGISSTQPLINEQFTYTLTTTNNGPSDNQNVVLTVALPDSVTFESASTGCVETSMTVTCDLGDISTGASVDTSVTVTGPSVPADVMLTASASGGVEDPDLTNNDTAVQFSVIDEIDIIIEGVGEGSGSFGLLELMLGLSALVIFRRRSLKQHRSLATVLACIAICLPLASAQSQQVDWYAGASVGIPNLDYSESDLVSDLSNLGWTINMPNVDHEDFGWKVFGGADIGRLFGVEMAYVDLGKTNTRFGASLPPNQVGELLSDTASIHPFMADGWTLSGVVRTDFADTWQAFAKAGVFSWEADANVRVVSGASGTAEFDQSGEDLTWGIGVKYMLGPQWKVRAEWERFELDEAIDLFSLGVEFRF